MRACIAAVVVAVIALRADATPVTVPDPALLAVFRAALNQPAGDIEDTSLATLTSLSASASVGGVIHDLTGIDKCINVTYLELNDNDLSDPGDLAPLSALVNCTSMYLTNSALTTFSGIEGMTALRSLYAWDNQVSDLSPLAALTTLEYLGLSRNPAPNLSPLAALKAMTDLIVQDMGITALTGLEGCTALKNLAIDNNAFSDLSPLSGLTHLEEITAYGAIVSDLGPLAGIATLKKINFDHNQITSLTPLSALTGLTQVLLNSNFFTDIAPLNNHTAITVMDIGSCPIADFAPLATLTGLETLNVNYGPLAALSPLSGLAQLTYLDISGDVINDLAPLLGLGNLATLVACNLPASSLIDTQVQTLRTAGVSVQYGNPTCSSGEGEGEGEGEGQPPAAHTADQNADNRISLSELLRVIQFYNVGALHCEAGTEDGFAPGPPGDTTCAPHASDYNLQDWTITLSELLRLIQIYNVGAYYPCTGTEDNFCLGSA